MNPQSETVQTENLEQWYADKFLQPDNLSYLSNRVAAITQPVRQDFAEIKAGRWPVVALKSLGTMGIIAANIAHVRAAATPYELEVAQATTPFLAVFMGAAIHAAWFGTYSNMIRSTYKEMPHTLTAVGQSLSVDKLDLPGLAPASATQDESTGFINRSRQRFKQRALRAAVMQGTPTFTYLTAAASQGQSDKEQKKLCIETSIDGAVGSMGKGFIMAGALTAIGAFEPSAAKDFYDFGKTYEGAIAINSLPLAIIGTNRAVKKIRRRMLSRPSESSADDGAAQDALAVVNYSRLASRQTALLVR
jgi:hypothetical protein